ncbi:MAG TPA: OmpA family protein [Acidimicrobiales bacterium]|nr:OmpA family protein [Acidimicrobiales bacterium]
MPDRRALAALVALLAWSAPHAAAQVDELDADEVEARILDVEPRILDVEARIVDVVVPGADRTEIPIGADVLFAFGSADLTPEARQQLAGVVDRIRADGPSTVRVEGHTDSVGDDATNQVLSERRAAAVQAELAGQLPGLAIEAVGFGETQPVAPNELPNGEDHPGGRQQNRRVTIVLVR